jgi:hypothetical protein
MPNEHDAERVAREFAGKLAARARHVCVLLGAGASVSAGLPTVAELETIVTNSLPDPFKGMLTDLLVGRNLDAEQDPSHSESSWNRRDLERHDSCPGSGT